MQDKIKQLRETASEIRKHIIKMTCAAKSGHPGGSLSAVEILVSLYFEIMKIDHKNPQWQDRDRFVLSKGHASPVLYSTLACRGFFDKKELLKFRKINSMLQGHPDMKGTPGVDMSTGSLGQGLAVANGMAIAGKLDNRDYRVYVMLGDGEVQEGMVWEAAMASSHYKLDNLTAFLDHNGLQIDGPNKDVMNIEPLKAKWEAFGWQVFEINGHNFEQIIDAVLKAKEIKGKPVIIIAKTVKGRGVSYMENVADWHGMAPNEEQAQTALKELEVYCNER